MNRHHFTTKVLCYNFAYSHKKILWVIAAIATEKKPFGGMLFSSWLQTFLMFTGEYNFRDLREEDFELLGDNSKVSSHAKTQIVLAQIIFVAFVFLFAVVVMNLLNAFAIGDIQVKHNVKNKSQ